LRVLLNVILGSRYGERFHRHTKQLDHLFVEYFGDCNEQSVSKLRQGIARRLKSPTRETGKNGP
jgi:hypothetical protein